MTKKYVAVTGCLGFIGRRVTQKLLDRFDYVYGVDSMTYAADPSILDHWKVWHEDRFSFVGRDIRDLGRWPDVDAVIHLAAETHVDNSLDTPLAFVETNVNGTAHLLQMTKAKRQHGAPHFIHISTDEVYGAVEEGKATTDSPLLPTSPYAASKAAADLLVQAWGKTFGLPYSIIRPTNAYGPNQYPEKLIPKCVRSLMLGREIPLHGDGTQTRQWLHVDDLADAILLILDKGEKGIWNVGGNTHAAVGEVAAQVCFLMQPHQNAYTLMRTGYERAACDARYAVDDTPMYGLGWAPSGDFWKDLPGLVETERTRFRF